MSNNPNFLIIGAARSGTTSLYSYLKEHPDIYLPRNKRPEPHFFFKESEYAQGLSYYTKRFFSDVDDETAIGEASTSYLFGPHTPALVHKHFPDMRLIAVLRNPLERAFSNYWHSVNSGLETLTFDEAVATESDRTAALKNTDLAEIMPFSYLARGLYFEQIMQWFKHFHSSQLHVIIFEDFTEDPQKVLDEVYLFLEVDALPAPKGLGRVENRSRNNHAQIPVSTRQFMRDYFSDDIAALGQMMSRDLTHWLG